MYSRKTLAFALMFLRFAEAALATDLEDRRDSGLI